MISKAKLAEANRLVAETSAKAEVEAKHAVNPKAACPPFSPPVALEDGVGNGNGVSGPQDGFDDQEDGLDGPVDPCR